MAGPAGPPARPRFAVREDPGCEPTMRLGPGFDQPPQIRISGLYSSAVGGWRAAAAPHARCLPSRERAVAHGRRRPVRASPDASREGRLAVHAAPPRDIFTLCRGHRCGAQLHPIATDAGRASASCTHRSPVPATRRRACGSRGQCGSGESKREAGAAVRAEPRPAGINIAAQRPGANKGGREEEKRSERFAGCPTKLRSDENGFVACGAPAAGRNSRSDTILRRKFRAAQHRFMRYRG
jgi:hypothetical protein